MVSFLVPKPRNKPLPPLPEKIAKENISKRLVKLRKLRGKTQQELADDIGITRSQLANYESGTNRLIDEMVIRFAIALKISSDKLLGLREIKEESAPNVRFIKRIKKIEQLNPDGQKAILKVIDTHLKGMGVED